jgi:hypothetical protein
MGQLGADREQAWNLVVAASHLPGAALLTETHECEDHRLYGEQMLAAARRAGAVAVLMPTHLHRARPRTKGEGHARAGAATTRVLSAGRALVRRCPEAFWGNSRRVG